MQKTGGKFLMRWIVSTLGLWIAAGFLSNDISYNHQAKVLIVAGLVLAIINIFLKPILVILSLPVILLSLGLFMIIINGLTILIVSQIYTPLHITTFWSAVFAGIIIGVVNFLVSIVLREL